MAQTRTDKRSSILPDNQDEYCFVNNFHKLKDKLEQATIQKIEGWKLPSSTTF